MSHISTPDYRPDIDGLRAFAVISVVIFHFFPESLPSGFVGVDIFFVISGYLISKIIFENHKKGTFSFIEFYVRRINRIIPALLMVLIASGVFGWFTLFTTEYALLGKHIFAGAGFFSNIVFWNESGYFDVTNDVKPLLHLWSLGVEEQFYIMWPLMVFIAWRLKANLVKVILFAITVSLLLNLKLNTIDMTASFYLPISRFWELSFGSMLACLELNRTSFKKINDITNFLVFRRVANEITALLGVVLLTFSLFYIDKSTAFPGIMAMMPVTGALLIIVNGNRSLLIRYFFSNRIAVFIGLISFPLYLWHWPLITFFRIINGDVASVSQKIIILSFAILLSWITYRFVELRVRANKSNLTLAISLIAVTTLAGLSGYLIQKYNGLDFRPMIVDSISVDEQFVGPMWQYTNNESCVSAYPLSKPNKHKHWFCMASSDRPPTLLVIGSSYANQFYPGLIHNRNLQHHSVLSIGNCDIGWAAGLDTNVRLDSPCSNHWELLQRIIKEQETIQYTIIAGLKSELTDAYIEKLTEVINLLQTQKIRTIIFLPHIKPDYEIQLCYSRPLKREEESCTISNEYHQKLIRRYHPLIKTLQHDFSEVRFFDPNLLFCHEKQCDFKLPLLPAFRDQYGHFSEFASDEAIKIFVDWAEINSPELLQH